MLIRSSRTGVISAPRWFPFVSNASRTPFNTQVDREKFLVDSAETNGRAHASGGRRRRKPRGARARARRSDVRARAPPRRRSATRARERSRAFARDSAPPASPPSTSRRAFPGMPRASLALGSRGATRKSRTSYPYGGVSNGARATVQTTCSTLSSDEIEIRGYTRSMRFLIGEFSGFANPEISRRWR